MSGRQRGCGDSHSSMNSSQCETTRTPSARWAPSPPRGEGIAAAPLLDYCSLRLLFTHRVISDLKMTGSFSFLLVRWQLRLQVTFSTSVYPERTQTDQTGRYSAQAIALEILPQKKVRSSRAKPRDLAVWLTFSTDLSTAQPLSRLLPSR